MKKPSKLILIIVLMLLLSLLLCSCKKNKKLESITISFVTNMDYLTIDPIVLDGTNKQYMPDDPERAGYIFCGWFYDKGLTQKFSVEDGLNQDIVLYAKWVRNAMPGDGGEPIFVESGGFEYKLDAEKDSYYIISYHGDKPNIVIPASYNGHPVIGIAEGAFKNNSVIETIAIQSSLQDICAAAFENCSKLKSFSITAKGSDYYYCDDKGILYNRDKTSILQIGMANPMTAFIIPENISIIRNGAFYGCQFSISFKIEGEYKALKENDFYGFEGTLTLGNTIIDIEKSGLNNFCGKLIFGDDNNITEIKMGAFEGYKGQKIILSNKIRAIKEHAFNNCFAEVDITNTFITTLGNNAFAKYYGEKLIIPSSVNSLGASVFYESTTTVSFEENSPITTIPNTAFARFGGTAYFPKSVVILEKESFWSLQGNAKIYFANSEEEMTIDNEAFKLSGSIIPVYSYNP